MEKKPSCDRAAIEAQVLKIARDLLRELGNTSEIDDVRGPASLEQDLGLESIARVELMSRLNRFLGTSLPENAIAEARTLDDVVAAITGSQRSEARETFERVVEPFPHWEGSSRAAESASGQAIGSKVGLLWTVIDTLYGLYAAGVFFVWLVLAWLLLKIMPPGQPAAQMTSVALRIYFLLIGRPIALQGRENIEAHHASIYVSNHTSYSDVLVVMALFGTNYRFVAKSEINDMPFIGSFLRKIGHFSFERGKIRARSRQAEQMEKALLRGESVFVFAEGTFTAQPGVRPFQLGAFRAAVKTRRPIIPVGLRGTREFLRDGTFLPKPCRITVSVSPPLFPAADAPGREWAEVLRLRDETRRVISSHVGEPLLHTPASRPQEPAPSAS